jgi:dephospho-CoA kinase
VILVGLTGGIGSGKSTVSARLAEHGAVIVDADLITRQVQQPGTPVMARIAERFGADMLDDAGALIRPKMAGLVFNDPESLAALNAIVHPAISAEIAARLLEERTTEHVVVLDVALLTENPRSGLQAKIVVDVPVEVQVQRLVASRGMDEADARARIAHQVGREERLATATHVIDNSGTPDELVARVDALWDVLRVLPQLPDDFDAEAASELTPRV